MKIPCLLALALLANAASGNPIAVPAAKAFKESAVVTITAEREHATVVGKFRYRSEEKSSSGSGAAGFRIAVPVLVPRKGFGPPSQQDLRSTQTNPQGSLGVALQVQYSTGGVFQTIRSCRPAGPDEWKVELPANLAAGVEVVMCLEPVVAQASSLAGGLSLELDYRQYHVRARTTNSLNLVYVPLFEERKGKVIDTASRPVDYAVEVKAAPGVALRLVSWNKVVASSSTLVRIAARHAEPIVVEVK